MRQVIRAFCTKIYCEKYHHAIFHRTVVPYSTLSFMNQGRKYRYIYYYYYHHTFFYVFFMFFFFILSNKVAWNRLLLKRSNSWQNLSWQDTTTIGGKSMPTPAATLHFSTHRHTVLVFFDCMYFLWVTKKLLIRFTTAPWAILSPFFCHSIQ